MKKKYSKPQRLDPKFKEIMTNTMFDRANRGLAKKNPRALSMREATLLMRTCPSFPNVLRELKTIPKKKKK